MPDEELGAAPSAALRVLHASLLADGADVTAQRPVAMTVAELGELTRSMGAARVTWEHLVRHDSRPRVFERLASPPGTEAWLMCWMPGHDTGFHDHEASAAAILVAEGEVHEERLAVGRAHVERRVRARSPRSRRPVAMGTTW